MSEQTLLSEQPLSTRTSVAPIPHNTTAGAHTWLAGLVLHAVNQYIEHPQPVDRLLQAGEAWNCLEADFSTAGRQLQVRRRRTFRRGRFKCTEPDHLLLPEVDSLRILTALYRLGRANDPFGRILLRTFAPLSIEQDCSGDYPPMTMPDLSTNPAEAISFVLRTLQRWCDWIEADLHLYAHSRSHAVPASLPEGVELANWHLPPQDDLLSAAMAHLGDQLPAEDLERMGTAAGKPQGTPWLFQEIDTLVISLWPLLKRHNWTYHDLLGVLRLLATSPNAYPCSDERDLASYCSSVLGLRQLAGSKSAPGSHPAGMTVALRLFPKN
jgi:hypothetical protein